MSLDLVNGTITDAGADYLTQRIATMSPVTVSHFILANLPNVDETTPADAAAGMPDAEHIVNDNVPVFRLSYSDHSAVVYSIVLGSGEGNYDFNYYGAVTDTGVLLAYCHIPLVKKRAGLGQLLNRNMLVTFSAAQALTGADIPAEAWQFDFSEALADAVVSVTGPGLIYAGSTTEYQITDYDEFSLYHVASSAGTASIVGSTVTLTLPPDADSGICTLDITRAGTTRRINIAIGAMLIAKPTPVTPVDGASDIIEQPTFTLSPFTTYPAGSDTLLSSTVRVFNAADGLVWESTQPAGQQHVMPEGTLQEGALYKWQGMHTGTNLGDSEWSELASFTTEEQFIYKGKVLHDGGIVASVYGQNWVVVAPATERRRLNIIDATNYIKTVRDGSYELPEANSTSVLYLNKELIDSLDTSGGAMKLTSLTASDSDHLLSFSTIDAVSILTRNIVTNEIKWVSAGKVRVIVPVRYIPV